MRTNQIEIPWYKSTGGIIFLSFFSLIIIIAVSFGALFTYYAWQIKFGNTSELENIFNPKITFNENLTGTATSELKNIDSNHFIRAHNFIIGSDKAQITIIGFIDFSCAFCAEAYNDFKQIITKYEPVIKVVYKPIPLTATAEDPYQAAMAAYCAGEQDKFFYYHDILFETNKLDNESLLKHALDLKLAEDSFTECLESQKYEPFISQDISDAIDLGLRGTPTYIVNNVKIEGVLSQAEWDQVILTELEKIQ